MDMIFKVRFWFVGAILLNFSWKIEGQSWYDVRLVDGWTSNEGRVEIYYFGSWGTVCDDSFGSTEADVVCQQLGYSYATNYYSSAYFGSGSGNIWMDNVDCGGYESSLSDCSHNGYGSHNCDHGEDVGVECYTGDGSNGYEDIRLVGGSLSSEGRVEVQYNGVWGTVCDDGWGSTEADVVCQQLGYTRAIEETSNANFGQGTGTIWLDDVVCYGYESDITDCTHDGWGVHNCAHSEDAGVRCYDADYSYVGWGAAVIAGIAVGAIFGCAFLVCIVVAICKGSSSTRSTTVVTASARNTVGPPPTTYPMSSYPASSGAGPNGPPPSYDQVNKPSAYSNHHGAPPPPPPQQTFNPVGGHAPAPAPAWQQPPPPPTSSYPPPGGSGAPPSYPPPGGTGAPPPNPYADLPPLAQPAPVPQAYAPPNNVPPPQHIY